MSPSDTLRALLDERGIEWWPSDDPCCEDIITYWRVRPFQWTAIEGEKDLWLNAGIAGHEPLAPEQAIAATVGNEPWEPSKEWKVWYNSLKHDNPTSIREAVENILYEAIDFGGDMGPNGNVWSGVDEGAVLTKNCIDGWVESVESIALTVGVDSNTVEAIRKLLDKFSTELCNAGCVVECETREERQRLIDAVKDKYAQTIAATVGVGTCKNIGDGTFVCSKCGAHVQITDVGRSYLDENGKRWYSTSNEHEFRYCPNCGRRIIEEVTE